MAGRKPPRLLYRVRQFWLAWQARPPAQDLALAQTLLSPAQMALFNQMLPGEQAHSLHILHQLRQQGEQPIDLQVAALLHDAGKSRLPLGLWERVWIVLVGRFAAGWFKHWGEQPLPAGQRLPFWQRPLVVACQHPAWGAEMAEQVGVSPLAAALIRRHQQKVRAVNGSRENELLLRLQAVDNEN